MANLAENINRAVSDFNSIKEAILDIGENVPDGTKTSDYAKLIREFGKGGEIVNGSSSYTISNAVDYPLLGLNLYGKSVQDGVPTPETPVDIVSVGDSGFDIISKNDEHFNLLSIRDNGGEIITKQPVSIVGKLNNYAEIPVVATGTGLKYQWQVSTDEGQTWKNSSSTGNNLPTISLTVIPTWNGVHLRCVITDANGKAEISNDAVIYVVSDDCEINTASIETALPLCGIPVDSDGNYTDSNGQQWVADELVYNADGTGKIIKHTAKIDSYNGEEITTPYISTTGALTTGAKVLYALATPQEIPLSAEEMTELMQLQMFDGVTSISNSAGAEMSVKYCTNKMLSEYAFPIMNSKANSYHTHDDRYYTESEIDNKLSNKADLSQLFDTTKGGETATGNSAYSLENTVDYPLIELNLYGKSIQNQYEGKNLFDYRLFSNYTNNGVTFTNNNDGTFTFSGTKTDLTKQFLCYKSYTHEESIALIKTSGTYIISCDLGLNSNLFVYITTYYNGSSSNEWANTSTIIERSKITITDTMLDYDDFQFAIGFLSPANKDIVTGTHYLQFEKGENATEFEPYVGGIPAPNSNYPQEIKSVGDNGFDIISKDDTHFNLLSVRDNGGDIITKQPVSVVGKNGETKQFIVSANGSGLTYQWWQNVNNGKGWVIMNTSGARQPIFSIPVADFRNGYKYRCVVTDSNGNSETSNEVTLYVVSDDCEITTSSIVTDALSLCGIPVDSDGNYTDNNGQQWVADELIYNADGTGKIIKNIGKIIFDGSEEWAKSGITEIDRYILRQVSTKKGIRITSGLCNTYIVDVSETGDTELGKILLYPTYYDQISVNFAEYGTSTVETFKDYLKNNPIVLYTDLIEPQEIELTAAEVDALRTLQTFDGVTNISNSGNADMDVKYCTNKMLSEYVIHVITLNDKVDKTDVQDNIESNDTTSPLSANQGRILNEKINNHTDNSDIHVTSADKSNWNGYATEIEQNKTDISNVKTDKVDKDEILNAGIKSLSYVPMFGGEFTVTTVDEEGYISPHSRASVTGRISKHYTYRITVNGEIYELPCGLYYFFDNMNNGEAVKYLGNLSLYTEDTSFSTHNIRNVPFCIIFDLGENESIDVFTQFPNTNSILVEQIQKEQIVFPKSLVWGDDYCPIEFKRNDGVFNGVSIGINSLKNTRGTFAIGYGNKVYGDFSTALGLDCETSGVASHAEGYKNTASGVASHAEGNTTTASGNRSHAEGYMTTASGNSSHAEGQKCITNGPLSHSGGNLSEASGRASFAHGNFVKATHPSQFVIGYANNPQEDSIFEIGNGLDANGQPANTGNTEPATRQNAFRVTQSGVAVVKTGLQIGNTIINEEQLQKIIALIK